ncbi:hypothetical protein UT300009_30110 [Paraclostridium bifermentans]
MKFLVRRPHGTVLVSIMKHKDSGKCSFVNLSKGHICPCKFDNIADAIADMDKLKEEGKIEWYKEISTVTI